MGINIFKSLLCILYITWSFNPAFARDTNECESELNQDILNRHIVEEIKQPGTDNFLPQVYLHPNFLFDSNRTLIVKLVFTEKLYFSRAMKILKENKVTELFPRFNKMKAIGFSSDEQGIGYIHLRIQNQKDFDIVMNLEGVNRIDKVSIMFAGEANGGGYYISKSRTHAQKIMPQDKAVWMSLLNTPHLQAQVFVVSYWPETIVKKTFPFLRNLDISINSFRYDKAKNIGYLVLSGDVISISEALSQIDTFDLFNLIQQDDIL